MASPTKYIPEQPYEDANGDLICTFRIQNADPKSKARIITGFAGLVGAFPVRGWLGIMRIAATIGTLFG